jgi:hypothetical protein
MVEQIIYITKKEYDILLDEVNFLACLREAGVDNWEGYSYACELYQERNEE